MSYRQFIFLIFISSWLIPKSSIGQELPFYIQYRDYYGLVNPASINPTFFALGFDRSTSIGVSYQQQWLNPDFPSTETYIARGEHFTESSILSEGALFGASFFADKAGSFSMVGGYTRGALFFGDITKFYWGIGVNFGYINQSINFDLLGASAQFDPTILLAQGIDAGYIDLGFGGFFAAKVGNSTIYGGISIPQQAISSNIKSEDDFNFLDLNRSNYLYGQFGINKPMFDKGFFDANTWVILLPSKNPNDYYRQFLYAGTFRFQPVNEFWIGGSLNSSGNLYGEVGINIPVETTLSKGKLSKVIQIGFSYGGSLLTDAYGRSDTGNSLELNMSYCVFN